MRNERGIQLYLIVYMHETLKQKVRYCLLLIAEEQVWKAGRMIRTDVALRGGRVRWHTDYPVGRDGKESGTAYSFKKQSTTQPKTNQTKKLYSIRSLHDKGCFVRASTWGLRLGNILTPEHSICLSWPSLLTRGTVT